MNNKPKDGIEVVAQGVDRNTDRYFVVLNVVDNGVEKQCVVECRDITDIDADDYTVQFVNPADFSPVVEPYNRRIFDDIEQEALMCFSEMKDSFDVQTG